jgi:LuxR family quorum sensing-dependent transcriptional regulator
MASALSLALDLVGDVVEQTTSEQAGEAFLKALAGLGATSLWARQFYLTPRWMDPSVSAYYKTYNYACIRDTRWWGSAAQRFSDTVCPVSLGAARFTRPYFTSEVTADAEGQYAPYYEAMAEFGVRDTLAVPFFGPHNTAAGLTIWFAHRDLGPEQTRAARLAGTIALEHMRSLKEPLKATLPNLSNREHDCLAFVAEGKSDWEISVILSLSQATVHQHIENAKRKLGVRTRPHAVAKHLAFHGGVPHAERTDREGRPRSRSGVVNARAGYLIRTTQ